MEVWPLHKKNGLDTLQKKQSFGYYLCVLTNAIQQNILLKIIQHPYMDTSTVRRLRRGCGGRAASERLPVTPLDKWSLELTKFNAVLCRSMTGKEKFYTKCVNCENNCTRCRNLLGLRSKHRMMTKFTDVVNELKQAPS